MSTLTLSLEQCQELLQEIREGRRHRLTGSEYKAIVEAVDNHRLEREGSQLAHQVVVMLARHEGPGSKPPFGDPGLNRTFVAESRATALVDCGRGLPAHATTSMSNPPPYLAGAGDQLQVQQERNRRSRVPRPA